MANEWSVMRSIFFAPTATLFVLLLTAVSGSCVAQTGLVAEAKDVTALTGTVTDGSGAAIPRAAIILTGRVGGGTAFESGDGGEFEAQVRPGSYTIAVTAPGFQAYSAEIEVGGGSNPALTVRLEVCLLYTSPSPRD